MLVLRRAFELLPARLKAGTFVDFGCGKGRTLIYAALSGFRRIVGVEFARDIASRCRANIETFLAAEAGIEAEIEVVEGDAAEFAIPDEATVFYFFNPFQRPLAERVVDNIQSSLCRDRRDACIVYVTLIYPEVFDGTVFRKRRSFGRDNAIYTPTWMKL
jgi:SAM-dependent methyltransferase